MKRKILLVIVGIGIIATTSFFLLKNRVVNNELLILREIFPDQKITEAEDSYLINGSKYLLRNLGDINKDNLPEFVLVEIVKDQGKTFTFYSYANKKLIEIGGEASLIPFETGMPPEEAWNDLSLIDITHDSLQEIIIKLQVNASNVTSNRVLTFDSSTKKYKNLLWEGEPTKEFDTISTENDLIKIGWHGSYERGETYYKYENGVLRLQKTIGNYLINLKTPEVYEYREKDAAGKPIFKEKREGNIWEAPLMRNLEK